MNWSFCCMRGVVWCRIKVVTRQALRPLFYTLQFTFRVSHFTFDIWHLTFGTSLFTSHCYILLVISDFGTVCTFFCDQKKVRKKTLFPLQGQVPCVMCQVPKFKSQLSTVKCHMSRHSSIFFTKIS